MELKKEKDGYSINGETPCFICYGKDIKQVFKNLQLLFIKLEEFNQIKGEK